MSEENKNINNESSEVEVEVESAAARRLRMMGISAENEENKDFFEGFEDTVISEVFQNKLAEHLDGVNVNTEEKAKFSIVTSAANLQF